MLSAPCPGGSGGPHYSLLSANVAASSVCRECTSPACRLPMPRICTSLSRPERSGSLGITGWRRLLPSLLSEAPMHLDKK
jgi:hypothetical protein